MLNAKKLTLAVLVQAALISTAVASEQSEAKGFVEDAEGSVLFRTGFIHRDKTNGVKDQSSYAQTAIVQLESGYTQGTVGVGVGAVGDWSFKLGSNNNSANNMIPRDNNGEPYDQWARGGVNVKARISNTEVRYGTQVLDLPVLASNTARLVPEYFTGVLATSREIDGLELTAGKFTKNQFSDQIATDQNDLDRAIVWGARYQVNDQLNTAYFGVDNKDRLERHYANVNYKLPLANQSSLTFDFSGYHTDWDREANGRLYSHIGSADDKFQNSIWAISTAYNTGPHNIMVAYQQNTGNTGYDYNLGPGIADGGQTIYMPNSYLSDFIGNDEKSVQLQYSLNFDQYGVPGLNWTSAFVYGWDIKATDNVGNMISDNEHEREFFNQVKYTVQSGFAKDASLRVRHSYYRASDDYQNNYIGDTNEWRLFLDIPVKLF
ncbi:MULTISPECIES: OprD family outer membrane porin [Acinetobacter]|uniref:OprD family outer membrane porin n=1 Tax=Acinetobacter TaxID=469 RepID=UPI0015D3FF64|nr:MULTISPECIES: OprD family outer membrane porin [Acinetobacter]MDM1275961.1 outer membrane porin, OprD family [Acinetobacter indicus]MDM1278501.1 outer membrane porin, OprD family [Acinetobacter indicus]MDM1302113.1 outer membrane porin, OprD family [Acinetobacter indicus]